MLEKIKEFKKCPRGKHYDYDERKTLAVKILLSFFATFFGFGILFQAKVLADSTVSVTSGAVYQVVCGERMENSPFYEAWFTRTGCGAFDPCGAENNLTIGTTNFPDVDIGGAPRRLETGQDLGGGGLEQSRGWIVENGSAR